MGNGTEKMDEKEFPAGERVSESSLRHVRLLEAITSTTPDFLYVFDRQGRFQYANHRLLEVWGLKLVDVVGKTCRELGYEQWHHDMHMREIAQVIETKQPIKGEVPFKAARTGIFGVYEYIFTPVLDGRGHVELIAGTTRDVTDRIRAQEGQQQSEAKLRLVLDAAELGTWTYWFADHLWELDERGAELYGTRELRVIHDEAMMRRIMHPDDIPLMWERVARACDPAGDGRYVIEYRVRRPDGGWRWVAAWARVEFEHLEGTRRAVRMHGASRDVTWRKKAEDELRISEERFRGMFEQSVAGIAEVDREGRFTTVNDRYCAMVGYTREELQGMRMQEITHPDDVARNLPLFLETVRSGRGFEIEKRYLRKDGGVVWVHNSVYGRRGPDGLVQYVGAMCVDVTERRRVTEELDSHREHLARMVEERTAQLQESSKRLRDGERLASLGTLTAGLGHDLHNALLPLRVHIQELAEAAKLHPELIENVAAVESMTLYLSSLSRGMQMLARDPEHEGKENATDMEEWCGNAHRVLASVAGQGMDFSCTVDKGTPRAAIADHRLTQAVFNLVQNARDAILAQRGTSRGGSVNVHSGPHSDGWLCVSVRDNGPGMDEATRRRCMEPFFTTKARGALIGDGGTGMGLALVNGIVTAAGGRIEIDTKPGEGSTFRMIIPAASGEPDTHEKAGPMAEVTIQDRRRAATVRALLAASGWDAKPGMGEPTNGTLLWVVEAASATPAQVMHFIQAGAGRRALVLADEHTASSYTSERVQCCDGVRSFAGLRRAIEQFVAN